MGMTIMEYEHKKYECLIYDLKRHLRHRNMKEHGGDVCSSGLFRNVGWFVSHALTQSRGHILTPKEPICCHKMSV